MRGVNFGFDARDQGSGYRVALLKQLGEILDELLDARQSVRQEVDG
jgi:hypothetical protein